MAEARGRSARGSFSTRGCLPSPDRPPLSFGWPPARNRRGMTVRLACWRRPVRQLGPRGRPLHHPEGPHPDPTILFVL